MPREWDRRIKALVGNKAVQLGRSQWEHTTLDNETPLRFVALDYRSGYIDRLRRQYNQLRHLSSHAVKYDDLEIIAHTVGQAYQLHNDEHSRRLHCSHAIILASTTTTHLVALSDLVGLALCS